MTLLRRWNPLRRRPPFRCALARWVGGTLVTFAAAAVAAAGPGPLATVQQGRLRGIESEGVEAFRGIPYAAPPVGSLRWRAPQPAAHWPGIRDASRFGALCPQIYHAEDNGVGPLPMDEDCLTLNVYAPVRRGAAPLPVMVWIHGGGFVNGSATAALYDGSALAAQGSVVVTLNYRLGRLGFFAHPALTRERPAEPKANFGLMDQIAGLRWVRQNIRAFGGDAANVTVFGESAGGFAVDLLMIAPDARGLFHRAISESGLGRGPALRLQPDAEAAGLAFMQGIGIASDDPARLRAVPVETILKAGDPHSDRIIAIDGTLVPGAVEDAFRRHLEAPVPFLVGYNALEFPGGLKSSPLAGRLAQLDPAALAAIQVAYDPPEAFDAQIVSDWLFAEPARLLARLHAQGGRPAYLYRFAVLSDAARPRFTEAPHASERQYVFRTLSASPWPTGPRDAAAAAVMSAYWVGFARHGDPNGDGRVPWERFLPDRERLLEFTDDGPVMKPVPHAAVLDAIEAGYTRTTASPP